MKKAKALRRFAFVYTATAMLAGSPLHSPRGSPPMLASFSDSQALAGGPVDDAEWARTLAARLEERAHSMAGSFAFAETQQALYKAEEDARQWRSRAEVAERKLIDVLPLASASCTACEEMLARLAQAKSLSDLSDLSRMIFEVRTAMMEMEERSNGEAHGRGSQARTSGGGRRGRTPGSGRGLSPPRARPQPAAGRRAAPAGSAVGGADGQRPRSGIKPAVARERLEPPAGPPEVPHPTAWTGQDALAAFSYPCSSPYGSYDAASSAAIGAYHPAYSYAASPSWWQAQPLSGMGQPQLNALQAQAAQHQQLMLLQGGQHPGVRSTASLPPGHGHG